MPDFARPAADRYFEDYLPGIDVRYGAQRVEQNDILRFAAEFDPQMIHTDAERATSGPFGGLIASGWHTAALMMRIFATSFLTSPGRTTSKRAESTLGWDRAPFVPCPAETHRRRGTKRPATMRAPITGWQPPGVLRRARGGRWWGTAQWRWLLSLHHEAIRAALASRAAIVQ